MYLKSFPFLLVKTTIFFYSITNANIVKGKYISKPKSHFRFDYAELHPIFYKYNERWAQRKTEILFPIWLCRAASYIGGECRKYREKLMEKKIVRFIFQFQYEFYYIIMLQKETLGSYTLSDTINRIRHDNC